MYLQSFDIVQAIILWFTLLMMSVLLLWPKMLHSVICLFVMWVSILSARFLRYTVSLLISFWLLVTYGHCASSCVVLSGLICFWENGHRCGIWLQPNGFCSRWNRNMVCRNLTSYILFHSIYMEWCCSLFSGLGLK